MARVYREAEYFVFLGTNEGFGMPYIEAAVSGATVVAVDQPLTQELLGRAAHLLPRVDDDVLVEQLRPRPSVDASATRDVADRYSWDRFATEVRKALLEVASAEEVDSRASSF
ncbi:hypothetical protein ASF78_12910 [Cellulomonas sp. Leaf334]|nr:hypothetical protein ASF78_12910 [Cellulomonas sp. Leaf334]